MLTPNEIHNKEFKKSFRGYDNAEVDTFLDQIVNDYEILQKDNENLKNRLMSAEKELEQYRKLEHDLQNTISIAQKTAEEVTDSAKQRADELRSNVDQECKNIKRRAELESRRLLDTTAIEIKQKMSEADLSLKNMRAEYDAMIREKTQMLLKIRSMFESELTILNQNIVDMPKINMTAATFSMQAESDETSPVEENSEPTPADEVNEIDEDVADDETKIVPNLDKKKRIGAVIRKFKNS